MWMPSFRYQHPIPLFTSDKLLTNTNDSLSKAASVKHSILCISGSYNSTKNESVSMSSGKLNISQISVCSRCLFTNCMSDFNIWQRVCICPQKMDKNRDGVVTLDEFIFSCQEVQYFFSYLNMTIHITFMNNYDGWIQQSSVIAYVICTT